MASQQRRNALEVVARWGPLRPREIATQLGCSQEAARALIMRMVADDELRREGDGSYALARGGGAEAVHLRHPDGVVGSHDVTDSVTPAHHGVTAAPAVTEQGDLGGISRPGAGVFVFDTSGRLVPWRDKAIEGGYD